MDMVDLRARPGCPFPPQGFGGLVCGVTASYPLDMKAILFTGYIMLITPLFGGEAQPIWTPDRQEGLRVRGHQVEVVMGENGATFRAPGNQQWPGLFFEFEESRSFPADAEVQVSVRNLGNDPIWMGVRVDNPNADGVTGCVSGYGAVEPGALRILTVPIRPVGWLISTPPDLMSMREGPKPLPDFDADNVSAVYVFLTQPKNPSHVRVEQVSLVPDADAGVSQVIEAEAFFPFVDRFGQMKHGRWPGKLHSSEEFATRLQAEEAAWKQRPAVEAFTRWGGWKHGPQLKATGSFYVVKHKGKWTLVDPDGFLFWSHGVTCVTPWAHTPIRDRRDYFAWLPERRGEWGEHYNSLWWTTDKSEYSGGPMPIEAFCFYSTNLKRKYGADWFEAFPGLVEKRFRQWGLNTLGNWTDREVTAGAKIPYTVAVHYSTPRIPGSVSTWYPFPDPFDPGFRKGLSETLRRLTRETANDPYCIGYFVDNEMGFGAPGDLALGVLRSPAETEAKQVFVEVLQQRYAEFDSFRKAWGIEQASWEEVLERTEWQSEDAAAEDLLAFNRDIQKKYFQTVRQLLEKFAPRKLYLGCRFHKWNDETLRIAAEEVDVLSFNLYQDTVSTFTLPEGLDVPVIVGEFHFGALDRGLFAKGLGSGARNQRDRARKYEDYVLSALQHSQMVGVHYFQYADQPLTGRSDGENYQVGFVDVTDTPYPEITLSARRMGERMYQVRYPDTTAPGEFGVGR